MLSAPYCLAVAACLSVVCSSAVPAGRYKLTPEQIANPLGHAIGDSSNTPIPPLPPGYTATNLNYTTDISSRAAQVEKYVGTKDQLCDEYTCYTWWDLYYVQSRTYWDPWHKASGNFYCTGTSQCQIDQMSGWETCKSWTVGLSAGIQGAIGSASASVGYSYTNCYSGQNTHSCTWSDQQCHCIWTQQQMVETGTVAKEFHWVNGPTGNYYWIWGWAPTSIVSYGCGSKCTDT